jgi:uncharacterized protein (DUF362 family)
MEAVAVCCEPAGGDALTALDLSLERLEWWKRLAKIQRRLKRRPAELRIIIAADMSFYEVESPTGVDPKLVERLLDAFNERGYSNVSVGGCVAEEAQWYENRDPRALADLVGYRYVTPGGFDYTVANFSEELVPSKFPPTSVLHGSSISRTWAQADVRINFAKNKTHETYYYALGLYNSLGILPALDKRFHYGDRLPASDVACDLLAALPSHLTLLDALESSHGASGSRVPKRIHTGTVIASTSTLLLDWIGALKMGLDPFASSLNGPALRRRKLPTRYEVFGDIGAYAGWENVSPLTAELSRESRRSWSVGAIVAPLIAPVDHEIFPHRNVYAGRVNAAIAQSDGWSYAAFAVSALLSQGVDIWRTLFRKDQLMRIDASLDLDLDQYPPAAYEAVEDYFDAYERLVTAPPLADEEIRMLKIDGANLFASERCLEVPFDEFVKRVDVARAIQMMNDYIGGRCAIVAKDEDGRATHQAERNVYIAQPNYLALYGGEPIDVTKLEYIARERDRHRIVWRTIASENGSAEVDDGSVTFTRSKRGTTVRIAGLQKFRLPTLIEAARYDLSPQYLNLLTAAAYRTYIDGTMANLEAVYEGEDPRIGYDPDPSSGEDGTPAADAMLTSLAERAVTIVRRLASTWGDGAPGTADFAVEAETVGDDGFYRGRAIQSR